eukprot:CAMPEP_0206190334 /NCGR_PEP_ID=MMETSP0166-20121206/4691_1 /ASSEMBLY_ACC=CAM_ASM_000260 /TAXON_ID=95228 /ORGANISM="Vannella robusta, Strain DIVA3 518/3/11/1/6" /LENGTH=284 /DNA_ID=CAMNT_0053606399 /DNA_START=382 /DNA_END=1239 /DNA_ORIENTATION=-
MSKTQFASALEKVGDFHSMKELCKLWSEHTDEQGKPIKDCNLLIFQNGIKPLWEEPANIVGGHWVVRIMRNEAKAEQVWYSLLMTVICGQLTGVKSQEVTGIVISPRDHLTQIYVWNKHSLNSKYKEIMQSFISDSLDVPKHWLRYNTHKHKVYKNTNPKKNDKKKTKKHKQAQAEEINSSSGDEREEKPEEQSESSTEDMPEPKEEVASPLNNPIDEAEEINDTEAVDISNSMDSEALQKSIDLSSDTTQQVAEPSGGVSMFSVAIGFAIFVALLYNLYVLFG